MKPLALDFMSTKSPSRWGGVLLVMGLALCVAAGTGYWRLQQHRDTLETQVDALALRVEGTRSRRSVETPDERARALGVVSERLSVPWEKLFQDIESCDGPDVALLQLQPNITQRQVMLMGEARDRAALESYMRRLDQTNSLDGVHLAQHNQAPESGPWAVRFALTAKWNQPAQP